MLRQPGVAMRSVGVRRLLYPFADPYRGQRKGLTPPSGSPPEVAQDRASGWIRARGMFPQHPRTSPGRGDAGGVDRGGWRVITVKSEMFWPTSACTNSGIWVAYS